MSNLFVVNALMAYMAVAGFVYGCLRFVNGRDGTQRTEWNMFQNAVLWMYYAGRNYHRRTRTATQLSKMARAKKDNVIVKQMAVRQGRLVALKKDGSDMRDGDTLYQFHHDVWKREFVVMEGWAMDGRVTWLVGHIDLNRLDAEISIWHTLMPAVRDWLQHKA